MSAWTPIATPPPVRVTVELRLIDGTVARGQYIGGGRCSGWVVHFGDAPPVLCPPTHWRHVLLN